MGNEICTQITPVSMATEVRIIWHKLDSISYDQETNILSTTVNSKMFVPFQSIRRVFRWSDSRSYEGLRLSGSLLTKIPSVDIDNLHTKCVWSNPSHPRKVPPNYSGERSN